MKSFDPDDDFPYVEVADEVGRDVADDLSPVDAEATLELLHAVTAGLPGGGEDREGQQQMASAVAVAISRRRHLVVEAGTGVGKSLAYLAPLATAKRRAVIATATKNLQDQLSSKDAPQVAQKSSGFSTAILKGKNNYYCHLRANEIGVATSQLTFDDGAEMPQGVVAQIRRIAEWAGDTTTGDRDSLGFEVDERAWRQVAATPLQCVSRARCEYGDECFHEKAKERAAAAEVVIVNHALYAAHLATGANLLPQHSVVIFDEAHEIHDTLASHLGVVVTPIALRASAGLLRHGLDIGAKEQTDELLTLADRLADALAEQHAAGHTQGLRESVSEVLDQLVTLLTALVEALKPTPGVDSLSVGRIRAHQTMVSQLGGLARIQAAREGHLVWINEDRKEFSLHLSLLDVGDLLHENLWPHVTAICTSATIPDTLITQLGLPGDDTDSLAVASPFDYGNHSLLYVAKHLPDRNDHDTYFPAMLDELTALINAAGGRTLALFTNRSHMEKAAAAVAERIHTPILVQGTMSKQRLTELFKSDESTSLFALDSFWQGFDIPGQSLSLVTIDRLPFRPPDDPVDTARRERLGDRGFAQLDLPRAAMMLAQGIGRLIRTADDRGVVAVFDNRLATKGYRHSILKKLPPMKRTVERSDAEEFLRAIVTQK